MSGHSKWSTIKRKKEKIDAKKGKIFTKLIKEITLAAREGGGDQNGNARLRTAVIAAKSANMPQDNIDRAIKKGTGEMPGVVYEEVLYEGYGPEGVAVLVETATDNKNRTSSELKHLFTKYGGNLGSPNCVAWMFVRKGIIEIDSSGLDEDKTMEAALDAGAEDFQPAENSYFIYTSFESFNSVREKIDKTFRVLSAKIAWISDNPVKIPNQEKAQKILKFMDSIEDQDDVQNVHANFDISDEILGALENQ
ncbi:YebC/PmpR family DNA-binding transcriptional regulator [candidate division WOR-3 bacterium]|nr:YebC/PmpR family DNA-binding transcriptional regulator [candidate division WOR-3 bacterium]